MDGFIDEIFERNIISAEPAYDLATCVELAPKDEDSIDDTTEAVALIKERFRTSLYLCDNEQLEFVRLAAERSVKREPWAEPIAYYPFSVFCYNDFMYLFSNADKYYLVLPDELIEIFSEVTKAEDFPAVSGRNAELNMYAKALLNLYGAYEIEQFTAVWNHHHKDKITIDAAREFLSDMMYFHSDYWLDEDFIIHDCLYDDDFDDLLDSVYDMDYYMPTKSVIKEIWNKGHDWDFKIPGEKEMDEFLAQYVEGERGLDDIQNDIVNSCERLKSPAEVRQALEEAGIDLSDEMFVSKFERLYQQLRDNTHIWELRGFTPYQYTLETGEAIPRFKLSSGKAKKKNRK